jgi:hypothetical protein
MKKYSLDPEGKNGNFADAAYPLMKVYTIGVNLKF